jgi:hypothetical protein
MRCWTAGEPSDWSLRGLQAQGVSPKSGARVPDLLQRYHPSHVDHDLVNGRCVSSVPLCTGYDSQDNCAACEPRAVLQYGVCVPVANVSQLSNCLQQSSYGCVKCQSGFRIDGKGQCQPAILGCMLHNRNGSCNRCMAPFYELVNGACVVVGCTQTASVCQTCDAYKGFALKNGRCEIEGCVYFDKLGCQTCSTGLVAGSWGCRKSEGAVCVICKSDEYRGADGKCYKKNVHCTLYQNGNCQSCCEGFFLGSDRECKPVLPGCVYSNGLCASCSAPFTYLNGGCVIDGCLQYCKDGCASCDQRLTLIGSICGLPHCQKVVNFRCQECSSGYAVDQNGQCVLSDPNCLKRNSLNQCLACKEGYQLDCNGVCTSQKYGCNYVDGRCTSCRSPFVYVPATESCEIDGCLDYFLGGCQKCDTSYALLYNTCKLPNCLTSKKGKCLECDPDYVFKSDGTCVSKDEFCEKMDAYGTCIKCMASYYYSQKNQRCVKKSPGCLYDKDENCYACEGIFTFSSGRCTISGCLRFDENGCYECQYPFSLSKTKTCEIARCTKYATDGHCLACQDGYALST